MAATTIQFSPEVLSHAQLIADRVKFWTPEIERLCRRWKAQINNRRSSHEKYAERYSKLYYIFGIPVVLLDGIVSSGIFATFRDCNDGHFCAADEWIRLGCAIVGMISMVISGLFVFLDYQSRAEKHKTASTSYEVLARDIDSILNLPVTFRGDAIHTLKKFQDCYNELTKNSPDISGHSDALSSTYTRSNSISALTNPELYKSDSEDVNLAELLEVTDSSRRPSNDSTDLDGHTPVRPDPLSDSPHNLVTDSDSTTEPSTLRVEGTIDLDHVKIEY